MDSLANLDLSPQSVWAAIGILCFILELVVPAFIMLFVGFGAMATATVLIFQPELSLVTQLLLFAGGTVASFLLIRPTLLKRYQARRQRGPYAEYEGELATVVRAGNEHSLLRVQFRGTEWDARPAHPDLLLAAGQTVKIVRMDGTVALVDLL